ncbi:MAG: DNA polymerase II large subunit [Candidatus Bathyarchaeota archaeon]|nr:MAG: DNA polymerase II large subunit [Candidatus Bathyarchaeota archaeon]
MGVRMSEEYRSYLLDLEGKLAEIYGVASKARKKGLDPDSGPEPKVAKDLAELVQGLVGPPHVAEAIRALSQKLPREELAFKIAEDIVYGKFEHMEAPEAAEQAIRTALAILTEGITAAPLQGVARVAIKNNIDRTRYLAIYYAGPIRAAGGTEQALTLVIGDSVRRLLALNRYKPTPEEIGRFVEEVRLYERTVSRFQYHISDEELRKAIQSIPVEVTGVQSNPVEVSSFRNLPRVETNRVRGGALLVVNDGVIGRSAKVWTIIEKLGIEGWDWLKNVREIKEKKTVGFMEDVIAGRPIFSFPSRRGGFRLRYGRARNTGLAAVGLHPATMMILQGFLAAGTQLRLEGPGKAGVALPVDTIEPPIVRLRDGSVVRASAQNLEEIKNVVDRILFLGDILIGFGDFLYNNKALLQSGLTEEWWCEELRAAIRNRFNGDLEKVAAAAKMSERSLEEILRNPYEKRPTAEEAISLALTLNVPLHPFFNYFWSAISPEELRELRDWVLNSETQIENRESTDISGIVEESTKRVLERVCIPHRIVKNNIRIEDGDAHVFKSCLGLKASEQEIDEEESVLQNIKRISGISVREKAPTFVGARMGRPEKAKRREMRPMVHALFPTGMAGGSRRDLVKAAKEGVIDIELVRRRCPECLEVTSKIWCQRCKTETVLERSCPKCGRISEQSFCPVCRIAARSYNKRSVNLKASVDEACSHLNFTAPDFVKGVRGLMNETKTPEIIEKGILRARYDLSVFKDGTIRFDTTNAPLTHFKAKEIDVSVEKLKRLGYSHDCDGDTLTTSDQICELKVQDVIIPTECAGYFIRVATFLDELLRKVYELPPLYNVNGVEDLAGHLVVGLAPHTSVGIVGRIIGFTPMNVCYAHPLWHSAKRRDCDGDEDALMLALDTVLNFSRAYLPAQTGGIMDAPLFIIPIVNPREVQRQAHEVDVASAYPVEFYEKAKQGVSSRSVRELIDLVEHRLNTEAQFEGFNYTVPVSDVNMGNRESTYKKLRRMTEKLNSQLTLSEKIDAVDANTVALKVLTTHFIRDIMGNLRAFATQNFRCKNCNRRFRRLPLQGKCPRCDGALLFTVHRGGIEKYLDVARKLVRRYELPSYYAQRLLLVEDEIRSLFEGDKPKQISLGDFMA